MMVAKQWLLINGNKSALPAWHLVSLFTGYSAQLNSDMKMFSAAIITISWVHFKATGIGTGQRWVRVPLP